MPVLTPDRLVYYDGITAPLPQPSVRVAGSVAWGAVLALQLRETPIVVTVATGLAAIRANLPANEREVLVVELTAREFLDTFELLQTIQDDYPLIRVIVVGELALHYQWWLREFGAVTVAKYVWEARIPSQIMVRHLIIDSDSPPNSDELPTSATLPNSNPGE